MPRKTKTAKGRRQAKTTSKKKSDQSQVVIEEPEIIIIGEYKPEIKEEETIPSEVMHTKKARSRLKPHNQNCDVPNKLFLSDVDLSQATSSKAFSIHEVQHNVSECNTIKRLRSTKGRLKKDESETALPSSYPDILETIPSVLEEKQKYVPQMKRNYNIRTQVSNAKTNEDKDALNAEINTEADIQLDEIQFDIRKSKTRKSCSAEIKMKINESQIASISSNLAGLDSESLTVEERKPVIPRLKRKYNRRTKVCDTKTDKNENTFLTTVFDSTPDVLESAILTVEEQKSVEPRVKQKYNQQTKVCDTKTDKTEDDFTTTVSNSNPDVLESVILTVEKQKLVEPRVKRKYNRRTKVCNTKTQIEDDSVSTIPILDIDVKECKTGSSLAIQPDVHQLQSASDDMQEQQEITPQVKRKYNKRTKVSDTKVDYTQRSLNSSLENEEVQEFSAQIKHSTGKTKQHIKLCSNTKENGTKSESLPLNPDGIRCPTPSTRDARKVTLCHNAKKSKKQKKESFATSRKHGDSQSVFSNLDCIEPEIKLEFMPLITESCKKHIKQVLLTAAQFQRHARRKMLSAADVSKALPLYRDFREVYGNVEYEIDHESVSDYEDESVQLSCHGMWLH